MPPGAGHRVDQEPPDDGGQLLEPGAVHGPQGGKIEPLEHVAVGPHRVDDQGRALVGNGRCASDNGAHGHRDQWVLTRARSDWRSESMLAITDVGS